MFVRGGAGELMWLGVDFVLGVVVLAEGTRLYSSAASDVYKGQIDLCVR